MILEHIIQSVKCNQNKFDIATLHFNETTTWLKFKPFCKSNKVWEFLFLPKATKRKECETLISSKKYISNLANFYLVCNSCCVFRPANACIRMVKNDEKHWKMMKKVPFPLCAWEAHVRPMKKNEEKNLLVSGWHPNASCSFRILLFFSFFLHEHLMCMTQNVFWKAMLRKFNILNRADVLVWVLHSIQ